MRAGVRKVKVGVGVGVGVGRFDRCQVIDGVCRIFVGGELGDVFEPTFDFEFEFDKGRLWRSCVMLLYALWFHTCARPLLGSSDILQY